MRNLKDIILERLILSKNKPTRKDFVNINHVGWDEFLDNFHKMNKLCLLKLIECTIHSESKLWILVRYVVWAKKQTNKKKPCSF